ncbi:hypothetical protein LCM20_09165 [Halobacillus litoralis]|uniref:hypothetical protein n=1 Tax=Halobacillus litoralis TaxID=45668 RepID=UPI001CD21668|nr:hypothetical protein [Halobacillus litoralis]MCA0970757.1 hypothetical protein [Halobacillus litoralis]
MGAGRQSGGGSIDIIYLVECTRYAILFFFLPQLASSLLNALLGWGIIDYFKWGIYTEPENVFDKIQNFIMKGFHGFAIYTYDKAEETYDNWFAKKLFHFVGLIQLSVVTLIVYFTVYETMKFVFY